MQALLITGIEVILVVWGHDECAVNCSGGGLACGVSVSGDLMLATCRVASSLLLRGDQGYPPVVTDEKTCWSWTVVKPPRVSSATDESGTATRGYTNNRFLE